MNSGPAVGSGEATAGLLYPSGYGGHHPGRGKVSGLWGMYDRKGKAKAKETAMVPQLGHIHCQHACSWVWVGTKAIVLWLWCAGLWPLVSTDVSSP